MSYLNNGVNGLSTGQVRRRSQTAPVLAKNAETGDSRSDCPSSGRSYHLKYAGAALLLVCTCLLLYTLMGTQPSSWQFPHLLQSKTAFASSGSLDYPLHPQRHIYRAPATFEHDWRITSGSKSPDGVKKTVFLINDEFPGPVLEARSGDVLKVLVHNDLENYSIAIHWHGIHMRDALEMDGTVGFTQCPIPPGGSYLYEFNVSQQHGTFWYHAHDLAQRGDGMYGGLVIHQPKDSTEAPAVPHEYDEERLLMISDWYHRPAQDVLTWYMSSSSFGNEPVPDSLIVNHGGMYDCSMAVRSNPVECVQLQPQQVPRIEIDSRRRYRFRLVNAGTLAGFTITIRETDLLPITVDGDHYIAGQPVQSIGVLYPGERMDFIATWPSGPRSQYLDLKVELDEEEFKYPNPALSLTHHFTVFNSHPPPPTHQASTHRALTFSLANATAFTDSAPTSSSPLSKAVEHTFLLYATTLKLARLHNVPHGFMNQTTWKPQQPALLTLPRHAWNTDQLVPHIPYNPNSPHWVDVILNNVDDGGHPFHLHGYSFWVLASHSDGSYWGTWNPFEAEEGEQPPGGAYNVQNPLKRDTVWVPRRGYVVLRFRADNPGLWMFHCHILWHQASGMAMGFEVGGNGVGAMVEGWELSRKESVQQLCEST